LANRLIAIFFVQDIACALLPLPLIMSLSRSRREKIVLIVVMMLGLSASAVNGARLAAFSKLFASANPTITDMIALRIYS
jgi:steroid 5-alpha reductase family enzyme